MNVQTTVRVYDEQATLEHVANYRKGITPTTTYRSNTEVKRVINRILFVALAATAIILSAMCAHAETFSYTGPDFTQRTGTAGTSVSGSFTINSLGANLNEAIINPSSWTFTDGVDSLTNQSQLARSTFVVWTNAAGEIIDWLVQCDGFDSGHPTEFITVTGGGDSAIDRSGSGHTGSTGFWTKDSDNVPPPAIAPTPEPQSLILLGTGLAGMAGIVRKRLWRSM